MGFDPNRRTDGSGRLIVDPAQIATSEITDGAVTTAKIANGAVTAAKRGPVGALTTKARAFATDYLPNAALAVMVLATFEIDCDREEAARVEVRSDSLATPVTIVAQARLFHSNADALNAAKVVTRTPIAFIVPAGYSYRFVSVVELGAPGVAITSVFEQEL